MKKVRHREDNLPKPHIFLVAQVGFKFVSVWLESAASHFAFELVISAKWLSWGGNVNVFMGYISISYWKDGASN